VNRGSLSGTVTKTVTSQEGERRGEMQPVDLVVRPTGLEPVTPRSVVWSCVERSQQLRSDGVQDWCAGSGPFPFGECPNRFMDPGRPIVLTALVPASQVQADLFDHQDRPRSTRLMGALDAINHRWGAGTLEYASSGLTKDWQTQCHRRSPAYTTDWGRCGGWTSIRRENLQPRFYPFPR
jgi:Domain of unknown function (DUF4113)